MLPIVTARMGDVAVTASELLDSFFNELTVDERLKTLELIRVATLMSNRDFSTPASPKC